MVVLPSKRVRQVCKLPNCEVRLPEDKQQDEIRKRFKSWSPRKQGEKEAQNYVNSRGKKAAFFSKSLRAKKV